jgi:uncharacterized glyoxalase superfamily protein PhnB
MPALGAGTPILRISDIAKAHEFYVGFLGFAVQCEHRFEGDAPLYAAISRNGCVLHLSDHYGDASPGAAVRIRVEDIPALHRELVAKDCRFAKPGLCETAWKTREISVTDSFGTVCTPSRRCRTPAVEAALKGLNESRVTGSRRCAGRSRAA